MAGEHLTGSYRVRAIRPALDEVSKLCRKIKDRMEIRHETLKLRYWPAKHPSDEGGKILDLDWSWIVALRPLRIGELRLDDTIGGNDNLRVIFFQGDESVRDPLPMIWVLRVMQKKRDDFSSHDLSIFKARRTLVIERFYKNRVN